MMDEIFIDLQISIEEGSDLDLKNEDCHILNDYIDSLLAERDKYKTDAVEMFTRVRDQLKSMNASPAHAVSWVKPRTNTTTELVEELTKKIQLLSDNKHINNNGSQNG